MPVTAVELISEANFLGRKHSKAIQLPDNFRTLEEDIQVLYLERLLTPLRQLDKDLETCVAIDQELLPHYVANPGVTRLSLSPRDYPNTTLMKKSFRNKLSNFKRASKNAEKKRLGDQVRLMLLDQQLEQTTSVNHSIANMTSNSQAIAAEINQLRAVEQLTCPVCLNEVDNMEPLHGTRREHGVCTDCRPAFLRRENRCPICREPLV